MTAPPTHRPTVALWPGGGIRVSRFDRVVGLVLLALLAVIALTLWGGDRVGVKLTRFGPTQEARQSAVVMLQFGEEMNRESVAARFRLDPPVAGDLTWSGRTMAFRPAQDLAPGVRYTVVLDAGAESEAGRRVLEPQRFEFTVRGSRVVYLAPVDQSVKNLWMVDPLDPAGARLLTQSRQGVLSFDVSPDGGSLVFAERNLTGGSDLQRLDLDRAAPQSLIACGDHQCTNPAWSPDGRWIAFDRQAATPSAIPGYSRDATRVWLLDLSAPPPQARPLFDDPQIPTHSRPRWSPKGGQLAVDQPVPSAARASAGVLVHDLASGETKFYAASGPGGVFSADGLGFFFPALDPRDGQMHRVVRRADLGTTGSRELPLGVEAPPPLELAAGPAEGQVTLAFRRAPEDAREGRQVYLMDLEAGGGPQGLVVDEAYDHTALSWDPSARFLAMERAAMPRPGAPGGEDGRSQVWVYDAETGATTRLASAAFRPRWVR